MRLIAKTTLVVVLLLAGCIAGVVYVWRSAMSRPTSESLVRFYTERGTALERAMHLTIETWRETGPTDPTHTGWRASVAILEGKKRQFTELYNRHIEVLRAGDLTLGNVYAQLTDEAQTGAKVVVEYVPGFYQRSRLFHTRRSYREPGVETFHVADLRRLLADAATPRDVRIAAVEQLAERCDASRACVEALVAVFTMNDWNSGAWIAAAKLCDVGASPESAGAALVKWLAASSTPWRFFNVRMPLQTLKCIGYRGVDLIPYLMPIMQAPFSHEEDGALRRLAMQLLGDIGPGAADAIPALRAVSESADEYSRSVALYALGLIETR